MSPGAASGVGEWRALVARLGFPLRARRRRGVAGAASGRRYLGVGQQLSLVVRHNLARRIAHRNAAGFRPRQSPGGTSGPDGARFVD